MVRALVGLGNEGSSLDITIAALLLEYRQVSPSSPHSCRPRQAIAGAKRLGVCDVGVGAPEADFQTVAATLLPDVLPTGHKLYALTMMSGRFNFYEIMEH